MNTATARRLLRLNRDFYNAFAVDFADSRRTLQPGIVRALNALRPFKSIVDVGCGDGRVGKALAGLEVDQYLGLDYSERLL
ncbi:MAG TPA: class I SAM-dependent methyltransferase, partial [Anaerolineae bacterium]